MTPGIFGSSLTSVSIGLRDLGLLQHPQLFASLTPSDAFLRVALDNDTPYAAVYLEGLKQRDYNFLLTDYSYFQFQLRSAGQQFEIRYGFYPNPFEVQTYEAFCEANECDPYLSDSHELYLQSLEDMIERNWVPPFRYEVSFDQYKELAHPTSHLHIGRHDANRWPVERILTPLAFTLLIAKHYYGPAWGMGAEVDAEGQPFNRFDRQLSKAKAECVVVDAKYFTVRERQHPYVG